MPELPEVETICRGLAKKILEQKIDSVVIHYPKLRYPIPKNLTKTLPGKKFKNISRRGKYILFKTKTGTLIVHLGMSGNLQIKPTHHKLVKHEHFNINFNNKFSLCYIDSRRFGAILWTTKDPLTHPLLKKLGPEPFAKNFTAKYLFDQAKNKERSVKQLIMDNHIVTGVGNIYANEVLFAAKINPLKKANTISLDDYEKLVKEIKKILTQAIKYKGTTIKDHADSQGKKGSFQNKLKTYGKQNKSCLICQTKLKHTRLGQRITVFCSRCQK